MDFYILKPTIDLTIIGDFPQVEKLVGNSSSNIIRSIDLWSSLRTDKKLPDFKLRSQAKLTDMLSCASLHTRNALLISFKAKELFKDYISGLDFTEYEANIKGNSNKIHLYSYIYLNSIHNDFIDFERSTFIEFDSLGTRKGRLVNFTNAYEYETYFRSLAMTDFLKYYQVYLKDNIKNHFFRIRGTFSGIIASEDVKECVELNQLTGFQFISLDKLTERADKGGIYEIID